MSGPSPGLGAGVFHRLCAGPREDHDVRDVDDDDAALGLEHWRSDAVDAGTRRGTIRDSIFGLWMRARARERERESLGNRSLSSSSLDSHS